MRTLRRMFTARIFGSVHLYPLGVCWRDQLATATKRRKEETQKRGSICMSMRGGGGRCSKSMGTSAMATMWKVNATALAPMKTESTKKIQKRERRSRTMERAWGRRCISWIFLMTDAESLEGVMDGSGDGNVPSAAGTSSSPGESVLRL